MNTPGYSGSIIFKTAASTYTSTTKPIRAIQILEDATFTTLTDATSKTDGIVTASVAADYGTVTAGSVLYGTFTVVTLASGRVKAYY
jgi:hypothetical protein